MGMSHKIERSDLVAGDHIYSYRAAFIYSHHGIYVGENKVVHYTAGPKATFSSSSSPSVHPGPCPNTPDCGFINHTKGVTSSCLDCFLKEYGSLYRYKYGVSKAKFLAKVRGGTCTTAQSDPPEDVIHRAMYLLDNNGFGDYSLTKHNCEDFALYCKTGLVVFGLGEKPRGCSGQVKVFTKGFLFRLKYDIGVREDAAKVEVEDLASYLEKEQDRDEDV